MATFTTKFNIFDSVYVASTKGIDKRIIKSIKINKEGISYSFGRSSTWSVFLDETFWDEKEIFTTEEEALAEHERLLAKQEETMLQSRIDSLAEKKKELIELQEEIKEIEYLISNQE